MAQLLEPTIQQQLRTWCVGDRQSPVPTMHRLLQKSIAVLESCLDDPTLTPQERADIALKILQLVGSPSARPLSEEQSPSSTQDSVIEYPSAWEASEAGWTFLPGNYIQVDNFLSPEEHQAVLDFAFQNAEKFEDAKTVTNNREHRRSAFLWGKPLTEVRSWFEQKVRNALPLALTELNHPEFAIDRIEMQMTAHNDGCFYKNHTDASSEKTASREMTYVYYFYREPKAFSGGELKLHDTELQGAKSRSQKTFKLIEPRNNSIIIFNSRSRHEVLPVSCPSQQFEDSRFTINGWIRREFS